MDAGPDDHLEQAAPPAQGRQAVPDAELRGAAPDTPVSAAAAFLDAFEMLKRVTAGLGLDAADVHDVLQDVYVQASRQERTLPVSQAKAWLVRVTVNRALLEHRKRKRFEQAADRIVQERPHREVPSPDALAETAENLAAMREAMQDLDENLLVVLSLRYFADLDSTQIGEALGLPPATVRRRLHGARLILARRLIAKGFGP